MRKQTALWKMKSGNKIRICDMSDQHLVNTMSMLMRNAASDYEVGVKFYTSCPPGVEEQEGEFWLEATMMDCINPIFWQMCDDARRRGLHLEEKWERASANPRVVMLPMAKAQ